LALNRESLEQLQRAVEARLRTQSTAPRAGLSLAANLALPVARFGWRETQNILRSTTGPQISARAGRALRNFLLTRLSGLTRHVTRWEWQVFCATPGLLRSAGSGREIDLARIFLGRRLEEQTLELMRHYPELRRLWIVQLKAFLVFTAEFIRHAASFSRSFHPRVTRRIANLSLNLSDPHNGGRCAIRVSFSDRTQWYYKPRSGCLELAWFALLSRINRLGFTSRFQIVAVVVRGTHCWMRAVPRRSCSTLEQVRRFYFRAGALLYLVHQLRGVDFHAGNLIAHGEQPVLIDCETLLHRNVPLPVPVRCRERSVCRTGLLPIGDSGSSKHVSALEGDVPAAHRPRLRGRLLAGSEFKSDVAAGFSAMHKFLQKPGRWRRAFAAFSLQLNGASSRFIHRPTAHYYALLEQSLFPTRLRDSTVRQQFLIEACQRGTCNRKIAAMEVRALANGDIPLLLGRPARLRRPPSDYATQLALAFIARSFGSPELRKTSHGGLGN
jgi:lantibiotic modifying enzyme